MKGLYFVKDKLEEHSGVKKKIISQIKALEKFGLTMEFSYTQKQEKNVIRLVDEKIIDKFFHSIVGRMKKKFFYYKKIEKYILNNNIEFLYIRYTHFADKYFLKFLKNLKLKEVKIFLEIPTYPYDEEIKDMKLKNILKEKKYRIQMKEYVNRIVTFSEDNEIFGVKTLKISNGVDLESIKILNKSNKKDSREINFIGVAMISPWHGFDRMILTMAEYYRSNPKEIIKFHIVGDGDKKLMSELREMVQKNKLEEYVIFYGFKSGKELDEIYNSSDIAIGSLGFYRIGLENGATLKLREYCTKGIPFVIGYEDTVFSKELPYCYQVPNNSSLLDIEKLIEWYKNLKVTSKEIREYAEKNLSWDKQMKKVVECIKELD